jgi:ferritin-like metal-binding protein YciE
MKMETLHDLYLKELRDLYGSEKLLVKALQKLAGKAESPELREALERHLEQTRGHVSRIEQVFQIHDEKPVGKRCKGLVGTLQEVDDDVSDDATPLVRDAAIIAGAQQVEHYEIAAYGTLNSYAIHLGYDEAAKLLQKSLDEEYAADRNLTEIAMNRVNVEATRTA